MVMHYCCITDITPGSNGISEYGGLAWSDTLFTAALLTLLLAAATESQSTADWRGRTRSLLLLY